ncbi:hypothetical protein C0Q70_15452 [Pomacea canaliculata]|uniref:G-protein coupled receptors family 1 profile domain-containing protein n=1 Tax=Pomacea canaliculata TaxID=400727 RepID=A0A2T7NUY8_POMCA|nr:hypothetical protein C0Q70_15452 [Pomacea canaliculata]
MDTLSNTSNVSVGRQAPIWTDTYIARNLVLGTSGIVLNIVTMVAIMYDRSGMVSSFRVLLLSLAVTDLGAMLVSVMSSVLVCYHIIGKTICKVFVACFYLCVDCTAVTTFLISAERGAAILLPYRYRACALSRQKLVTMVISSWLISCALVAASLVGGFENRFKCIPVNSPTKGGVVLQGLLQLSTALGVGTIYLAIAFKLRQSLAKGQRSVTIRNTALDPSPSASRGRQLSYSSFYFLPQDPAFRETSSQPFDPAAFKLTPQPAGAGSSPCQRSPPCDHASTSSQSMVDIQSRGTSAELSRTAFRPRHTDLTRSQLRLTVYAAILTVWFCLSYLPFGIYYIWIVGSGEDRGREVNTARNLSSQPFPFLLAHKEAVPMLWQGSAVKTTQTPIPQPLGRLNG